MKYWNSGEWQVVEERLRDLGKLSNPPADRLFEALRTMEQDDVRVVIVGQDPYPDRRLCTGIAFAIPEGMHPPLSLLNIFKELEDDLHLRQGENSRRYNEVADLLQREEDCTLKSWVAQGVLLWNAYPSCTIGKPASHHWEEWQPLTQELVEVLSPRGIVFVFLGNLARHFAPFVTAGSKVIETSHPSPLGAKHGFLGSRIFSRTNGLLAELGKPPIDWRLDRGKHDAKAKSLG